MNATRLIALLSAALLAICMAVPSAAPASKRSHRLTHSHTGLGIGVGSARVVKHGKWQRARAARRRARAARRRAAARAKKTDARPAPVENPDVLFRGDFNSGFDGWHVQSLSYRASLLSGGTFEGSQAARFEVQPGDVEPETGSQRSEVSGPTFDQGDDIYIRDAIRIPAGNGFSGSWQIIQQLHEENWSGSPGMALFLDEDQALRLGPGDGSHTFWEGSPLQSNRWYDVVYRVKLSQDADSGFVEVWVDGVQQTLADGGARAYGRTIQSAQTYLKAGVYRSKSSDGASIVEHDAIVVGTSYAAATS
ncbi:MAG TPA: heparin lyase I family protein [Solirubrobacterales bacterium]|nr:heparin lyase I family protein [Solirubrobacterales bacterium]